MQQRSRGERWPAPDFDTIREAFPEVPEVRRVNPSKDFLDPKRVTEIHTKLRRAGKSIIELNEEMPVPTMYAGQLGNSRETIAELSKSGVHFGFHATDCLTHSLFREHWLAPGDFTVENSAGGFYLTTRLADVYDSDSNLLNYLPQSCEEPRIVEFLDRQRIYVSGDEYNLARQGVILVVDLEGFTLGSFADRRTLVVCDDIVSSPLPPDPRFTSAIAVVPSVHH